MKTLTLFQQSASKSYGILGLFSLSSLWFKFFQNDTFSVLHFYAKTHIKWKKSYTTGIEILICLKIDFPAHNHSLIFNLQNLGYTIKIQSKEWHIIYSNKIMKYSHNTVRQIKKAEQVKEQEANNWWKKWDGLAYKKGKETLRSK